MTANANSANDPSQPMAAADGDHYYFDEGNLIDPNDDIRRLAIIEISKRRMTELEDRLIHCLESTEKSEANRRHIVRALGNIGSSKSIGIIRATLEKSDSLIAGEAAEALAKLGDKSALATIMRLVDSPIQFVASKAKWAADKLKETG